MHGRTKRSTLIGSVQAGIVEARSAGAESRWAARVLVPAIGYAALAFGGAAPAAGSDLEIGAWSWSIPSSGSGTASATVTIHNRESGGRSGSIGLRLRLSTAPYGQGGTFYTIASVNGLRQLDGGFRRSGIRFSDPFNLGSVPAGTYNVVLVVAEYTGGGGSGYTIRDGATASRTVTISSGSSPTPTPGPTPIVPPLPGIGTGVGCMPGAFGLVVPACALGAVSFVRRARRVRRRTKG